MKKISMYLDELVDSGTVKNDSDTARRIGVTRAAVSDWRTGRRAPDDDQAVKLTELLGKDPGELLAECGAARAKTPATRQAWERIAARMASYSITICAMIITLGHSEQARAQAQTDTMQIVTVFRTRLTSIFQRLKLTAARYDGVHKGINVLSMQPIICSFINALPALLRQLYIVI